MGGGAKFMMGLRTMNSSTTMSAPRPLPPLTARGARPGSLAWLPAPMRPGLAAVRLYARPFLLIQACALLVVVAFYTLPGARSGLETLAAWKDRGGLGWAVVVAAVAGGVLPEAAKAVALGDWRFDRRRLNDLAFNTAFFALLAGVGTNLFYQLQSLVFGDGTDWLTVLKKVSVDQGVYTVLFTSPVSLVVYRWRAHHYDARRTLASLTPLRRTFVDDVLPVVIPAWFYWTPLVLLIYSLPTSLQFVLFIFALAAWSLILTFVASRRPGAGAPPASR